jgi:activating signal cointegrator 1
MRAVTVQVPYGPLIVNGIKEYETRTRPTKHRGLILIHSGKSTKSLNWILSQIEWTEGQKRFDAMASVLADKLVYGAIIGYADLVECYPVEDLTNVLTERERLLGDFTPGRYAWQMKHARAFETPIPCKGQLGLWNVSAEIEDKIKAAVL